MHGQPLISLAAGNPTQQLIDRQLASAGIVCQRETTVTFLVTQIALVETNEGVAP